jgi:hypothetical protein
VLAAVVVTGVGVVGARAPGEEPLGAHQRQGYARSPMRAGVLVPVVVAVLRWHIGTPPFVEMGVVGRPRLGQPFDLESGFDAQIADLLEGSYAAGARVAHGLELHLRHNFAPGGANSGRQSPFGLLTPGSSRPPSLHLTKTNVTRTATNKRSCTREASDTTRVCLTAHDGSHIIRERMTTTAR